MTVIAESPIWISGNPATTKEGGQETRFGSVALQDASLGTVRSQYENSGWQPYDLHSQSALADSLSIHPYNFYQPVRTEVQHALQALVKPTDAKNEYTYKSGGLNPISGIKTAFTATVYPFLRTDLASNRWDLILKEDGIDISIDVDGKPQDRTLKEGDKARGLVVWQASNSKKPMPDTGIRLGWIESTFDCRYINKEGGWTGDPENLTWNWWNFTAICPLGQQMIDNGTAYKLMGYTKMVDLLSTSLTKTLGVRPKP